MGTDERQADLAFCCFGLLCRPEGMEALIRTLPEHRQQRLRAVLSELAGRPKAELVEQIRTLRQRDVAEALRSSRAAERVSWEALPAPLRRWIWEREQGFHGREDYQSPA